jgi:hypothetical protein
MYRYFSACMTLLMIGGCLLGSKQSHEKPDNKIGISLESEFGKMMVDLRERSISKNHGVPLKDVITKAGLNSSHGRRSLKNLSDSGNKGRWGTGRQQEPGMWFSIHLPKPIEIKSITMNHGISINDFPRVYEVYFSNDGKNWGEPVTKGKGEKYKTLIKDLAGTTKHIKILQTGKSDIYHWSIYELKINGISIASLKNPIREIWKEYPHQTAWLTQDALINREEARKNGSYNINKDILTFFQSETKPEDFLKRILENSIEDLKERKEVFSVRYDEWSKSPEKDILEGFKLYEEACRERRKQRLAPLLSKTNEIIFATRPTFGGIFYINETSGTKYPSNLCRIDLSPEKNRSFAKVSILVDSRNGMMRNPDVSYDGKRILFAWRKTTDGISSRAIAPDTGNYQIYEMELATGKIRQLTTDETYGANKEPIYLPDDNILFNSQRIVQHITCGWGDCSNFYLMNKDGKYQRRVGFDQTNTVDPTVSNDGRILYLRRDYNDRGQTGAHALFQMNMDGTAQTEYYGNQTGSPNSFQRPAAIPGSNKIFIILGGYHTEEGGQLAIMDVKKGRQNDEGLIRIPQGDKPPTSEYGNDQYGKHGIQYTCPRAISESELIVCRSEKWGRRGAHYRIFFMNSDGERELLASDPHTSCMDPVLVMARPKPFARPSVLDYRKKKGTFFVQNVYLGAAAQGIKPGTVKRIRVIEMLFKHDTIHAGLASGPGGRVHSVTTPGHGLASFDTKRIIGSATVYKDGSAMFEAPARKPLYFQLLDERNRVIQTMRSWVTLMPAENFSCVGCHEDKNDTPVLQHKVIAMEKGPEKLKPFYGEPRPFNYVQEVQPVFDKYCVSCHKPGGKGKNLDLTGTMLEDKRYGRNFATSYIKLTTARPGPTPEKYAYWGSSIKEWSRRGAKQPDEPNRYIHYWTRLNLMGPKPPYFSGSIKSGMIKKLEEGHVKDLPQEAFDRIQAWIDLNIPYVGNYMDNNNWTEDLRKRYKAKIAERKRNEAIEAKAIEEFIKDGQPSSINSM